MSKERWKPAVTVAAIIEHAGRYLLVEEHTSSGLRLNNPAGHLEPGESIVDAVVRETLEETARVLHPTHLVGVYLGGAVSSGPVPAAYLRFAVAGQVGDEVPGRTYDPPIVRTLWMTLDELRACPERHRSPMVLASIEDHAGGRRFALDLLRTHDSVRRLHP